jgi:hypothetical protein
MPTDEIDEMTGEAVENKNMIGESKYMMHF